jgi:hypothetical protein
MAAGNVHFLAFFLGSLKLGIYNVLSWAKTPVKFQFAFSY